MAQAPYSQYRNPALGPSLCEDGPRQNSSAGMQRSTSQSTNCTIDSCYSASSCSSGYHTADCSSTGFPIDDGPCFDSSYSVYPSSYFDSQDTDHLVLATGSQYQHAGQQLPRALQVYTPLHLFDNSLGNVEQTSQQATDNASSWIANERVYGRYELSVVTSQAVKDAQRELQGLGLEASPRAAVQKVIYDVLYSHFNDTDSCFTDAGTVLDEAAYQLQRHLQGPEAIQICYIAIVSKLLELRANLENESYGGQTIVLESPSGKATQSSTQIFAEKEKYICEYPGCGKEASRPADRDRHFRIVHLKEEDKTKYLCDYKKCSRHTNPFFRQDHFRDHLRIYHKEDLLRRGNRGDREWWESRAPRALFGGWWRCSRCLVRVNQSSNGFVCAGCGNPCESERQRRRLNARA